MAANKPVELSTRRSKALGLSPEVQAALVDIQADLAEAYRESFTEMVRAIQEQASALNRIQNTLSLLITNLAPTIADQMPPMLRVAGTNESPDVASAVIVADPIAQGFTLSLASLAKAIGVSAGDLGVLVKALKLNQNPGFSVVVREGKHSTITNYHARAIEAFRNAIAEADASALLEKNERSALKRAKQCLVRRS